MGDTQGDGCGVMGELDAGDQDTADRRFGYLSQRQGARLRALTREAFAIAGVEVVVRPDRVEADDGRQFGLANLAALCHATPRESAWPKLIQQHVRKVLALSDDDALDRLSVDDVLPKAYLRIANRTSVPDDCRESFRHARPVVGDVVEMVAVDTGDAVRMLRDEDLAEYGEERVRDAALENLLRDPIGSYDVHRRDDGASLHVVLGGSVFVASKLLVLTDLLRRTVGERGYPHGVLVAVPYRHELLFHPVDDPDAVPSLQLLTMLARKGFDEGVGAVSPFVYWWRDGSLTQLTFRTRDGGIGIDASGEFGNVLRWLLHP